MMSANWLDLLAKCDIYDPLDGLVHQMTGNWVRLEWDRGGDQRGIDVERELKRLGVDICGRDFTLPSEERPYGTLSLLVRADQARWAEYIMTTMSAPLVSEPIDARSVAAAQARQGRHITAWSERPTSNAIRFENKPSRSGWMERLRSWLLDE